MKAIKAFFSKVWAWVLAHKIVAGVIAGAVTLAIVTAIVVPVSVSSARKKRAAEETQQTDNGGSQPNSGDQGGQQGGGDSTPAHVHTYGDLVAASAADCTSGGHAAYYYCEGCKKYFDANKVETTWEALVIAATGHDYQFDSFVWTTTPGAFTAKAKYVCSHDNKHVDLRDATVTKQDALHVDPTCAATGSDTWHAEYDGHTDDQIEGISALGHLWGEPDWEWSVDHQSATASFECQRAGCTEVHQETATVTNGDIEIQHIDLPGHATAGQDTYTATVSLDGTNYVSNPEPVAVPETGHDWNESGYCLADGAYKGDLLTTNTLENIGALNNGEKAYYRVQAQIMHEFKLENLNELTTADFTFKVFKNGQFIDAFGGELNTFRLLSDLKEGIDGYVYITVTANGAKTGASFQLSERHCTLTDLDNKLCIGCGEYFGDATLEPGTPSQSFTVTSGEELYFRFHAHAGHTYQMPMGHLSNFPTESRKYIDKNRLVKSYSSFSSAFPNDSLDGFVYVKFVATSDVTGTAQVDINTHPYSEFGLCADHPNYYSGTTLTVGTPEDVDVDALGSLTCRFDFTAGHAYTVTDPTSKISQDMIQAYSVDSAGDMQPIDIGLGNYLEASSDTHIYLIVTNDSNDDIIGAQLLVTESHNYSGIGLCACGAYLGADLYDGLASGLFDLAQGINRYFHYVVVGTGDVGLRVNYDFSNSTGPGMDEVTCTLYLETDTGFELCEIAQPGQFEDEWKTADGWFTAGNEVYIVINNGAAINALNMRVTVTEF